MAKSKDREKCSWTKGHQQPTNDSYQEDLKNWWLERACSGECNDIDDLSNIISRLRDYVEGYNEDYNVYGFPADLTDDNRLFIVAQVLWKIQEGIFKNEANFKK
tara:strand:- start:589 stop:900 length:312 start_codon:yes stop_codon:yes gene_type:complete